METTEKKPTSVILSQAAQLIDDEGLAYAALRDAKGRVCAMGAINIATHGNSGYGSDNRNMDVAETISANISTEITGERNNNAPSSRRWPNAFRVADWSNENAKENTPEKVVEGLRIAAYEAMLNEERQRMEQQHNDH